MLTNFFTSPPRLSKNLQTIKFHKEIKKVKGNLITKKRLPHFQNFIQKSLENDTGHPKNNSKKSITKMVQEKADHLLRNELSKEAKLVTRGVINSLLKEYQKCLNKIKVELNINGVVNDVDLERFLVCLENLENMQGKFE